MIKKEKNLLILPLTLGISLAPSCSSVESKEKPNILFILADDLGITDLGCYGSSFYETPNIDALASDGVLFTNGYASCPVSSPTRASILTGKYPARLDITDWIPGRQAQKGANDLFPLTPQEFTLNLPLSEYTLGEAFKDNGYQTMFVGKWHAGEDSSSYPEHQGFDINIGGGKFGHPPMGYFSPYGLQNLEDGVEGEFLTERLADECVRLLDGMDGTTPFLLYYSLYQVHTPLQAKEDKISYFENKAREMDLTEENSTTSNKDWIREIPITGDFQERTQQGHPVYAAMVSHMDDAVGRVISRLKEKGLYDNTIIIFTSDNGGLSTEAGSPTSNNPYRAGKGWGYEGGVRVPVIIRWPGMTTPGTTHNSIITSPDFYPSLLEMAGAKLIPGQHIDGESFVPVFSDDFNGERGPVFWHYPHYSNQGGRPYGAVRKGNYKLIEHYEDMRTELFDLGVDMGELDDISAIYPEVASELKNILHDWRRDVEAKMPVRTEE